MLSFYFSFYFKPFLFLILFITMHLKNHHPSEQPSFGDDIDNKHYQINNFKIRFAIKEQRKQLQKRIFGQHYNYSKVGLNKEKKYMIEEQRNTEIERSNRILLQKIQRISKRSVPIALRKRAFTQQVEEEEVSIEEKPVFKNARFFKEGKESDKSSQHQLTRMNTSEHRSPRAQRRLLFSGVKEVEEKAYQVKAFMQKDRFVLQIEMGKMNQKIKIDMENYKIFYREYLEKQHENILNFLQFNGTIFQLSNMRKESSLEIDDSQFNLPSIANKTEHKNKMLDKINF